MSVQIVNVHICTNVFRILCHNSVLVCTFICVIQQLEDAESGRRQMHEKISDLERRLTRDVAASRDVDSLRAELQAAKIKIEQLQTEDNITQYCFFYFVSFIFETE